MNVDYKIDGATLTQGSALGAERKW